MIKSYGLTLTQTPAEEPVTLSEAKHQCQVPQSLTDNEAYLQRLITAARLHFESQTNRQVITAEWELTRDDWPEGHDLFIPLAPLASVASITYVDEQGDSQTMPGTDWYIVDGREPGLVRKLRQLAWPSRSLDAPITVKFTAGYGDASAVPEDVKGCILMLVDDWFHNRMGEGEAGPAVKALMHSLRYGDEFSVYG